MDWNAKVKEALERTEFMALSTSGPDGVWTNPVAFAYGPRVELFFISMLGSRHSQNIVKNPAVSAAIFKTERFSSGDTMGLQLSGIAKHLTDPEAVAEAAKHYFGRSPSNEEFRAKTTESGGPDALWHFFTITPTELWLHDSREFGEERVQVDLSSLNLSI